MFTNQWWAGERSWGATVKVKFTILSRLLDRLPWTFQGRQTDTITRKAVPNKRPTEASNKPMEGDSTTTGTKDVPINCTPDVLSGVGIFTSIFCPSSDGLKLDFSTTFTSILVRPTSRTSGITRNGNEMSLVRISSNSPSGGMKLIECSVSNLLSFTH
uniref:Uncharacterized protein n=1 Tax=Anopheles farauti TaxID=69004 RepID=A0A182Q0Q7_9DIPT